MTLKLSTKFVLVLNVHRLLFPSFSSLNRASCSTCVFFISSKKPSETPVLGTAGMMSTRP